MVKTGKTGNPRSAGTDHVLSIVTRYGIRRGSIGGAVSELQKAINAAFGAGTVDVDGIYGLCTENIVQECMRVGTKKAMDEPEETASGR